MPKVKDYYETLGVPRTASQKEISSAFRKLARKHHPDLNAGDKQAEARFKEVSEAHNVLHDPKKRKLYDQFGPDWAAAQAAGFSQVRVVAPAELARIRDRVPSTARSRPKRWRIFLAAKGALAISSVRSSGAVAGARGRRRLT